MWNHLDTGAYEGLLAETTTIRGHGNHPIRAYWARPLGSGPYCGLVLVHHAPGWDEFYRETARRFAQHGYSVVCPDLYSRFGTGAPDDVAAVARAKGGPTDDAVVGDLTGAIEYLQSSSTASGKVGIAGSCSGGRHALLTACRSGGLDAAIDLWGGSVIAPPDRLTPQRPVAPIDYTIDLSCPLLGIFGNDDHNPTRDQVDEHEAELKRHGKVYEFHRYDGAGHGFIYYHTSMYRQEQAMDAWSKMFEFLDRHLGAERSSASAR